MDVQCNGAWGGRGGGWGRGRGSGAVGGRGLGVGNGGDPGRVIDERGVLEQLSVRRIPAAIGHCLQVCRLVAVGFVEDLVKERDDVRGVEFPG